MADWTQADIDNLKAAIASGVLSVHYSGPPERTVVYPSVEALRAALALVEDEVRNAAGTKTRYRWGATRKGL